MKSLSRTAFVGFALLAACTPTPEDGVQEGILGAEDTFVIPAAPDPCGARTVQFLAGRPETALKGRRYAAPLRLIRPGDEVDKRDVNVNRLTVRISETGRIASLTCG